MKTHPNPIVLSFKDDPARKITVVDWASIVGLLDGPRKGPPPSDPTAPVEFDGSGVWLSNGASFAVAEAAPEILDQILQRAREETAS